MEGDVPALVADEVFIVRREQMYAAAAESAGAAIPVKEQVDAFPPFPDQFRAEGSHALPAIVDPEAAPPGEVFQAGGTVAAEILPGQQRKGFFPWKMPCMGKFV